MPLVWSPVKYSFNSSCVTEQVCLPIRYINLALALHQSRKLQPIKVTNLSQQLIKVYLTRVDTHFCILYFCFVGRHSSRCTFTSLTCRNLFRISIALKGFHTTLTWQLHAFPNPSQEFQSLVGRFSKHSTIFLGSF